MKLLQLPIILLFSLFLISTSTVKTIGNVKENSFQNEKPDIQLKETTDILKALSSDATEGRDTGKKGFDKAAKYVEVYLATHKIAALYGSTYRDKLAYSNIDGYNLLAIVGEFDRDRETIVLGAHLDHVGKSGGKIFNGANDNATGCTALMQIAAYLNQFEFNKNIIVAFFSGEEKGLLGSKDLARKLRHLEIIPEYMINFEMLGIPMKPGDQNEVYLSGYQMSNMAEVLNNQVDVPFVTFFDQEYGYNIYGRSDNLSFYQEFSIPSHTLISYTVVNDKSYHQHSDEFKNIDLEYLNRVINTSAYAIAKMIDSEESIELDPKHKIFYNQFRKR